jgi:recombination protein RecT
MGKGWKEDFDAMARKTVIRRLCGKYALMSIEYQDGSDKDTVNLATALAQQDDLPDDVIVSDEFTEATDGQIEYPDFLKEETNNGND